MKDLYETKISDARWIAYDIPANIGWIAYIVCLIVAFFKRGDCLALNIVGLVPAAFMLVGLAELISERIAKLDRVLPKARLLRGFGAFALGGCLGAVLALVAVVVAYSPVYLILLIGSLLCGVFGGLLFGGYKRQAENGGQDE